jgi:hypothetical protein
MKSDRSERSDRTFLGGSISTASRLPREMKDMIGTAVESGEEVVVGDAPGADSAIQRILFLFDARRVTVYHSGPRARNNIGSWREVAVDAGGIRGREFFQAKDEAMRRVSSTGIFLWNGLSVGTAANVMDLVSRGKYVTVFSHDGTSLEADSASTLRQEACRLFGKRCLSILRESRKGGSK